MVCFSLGRKSNSLGESWSCSWNIKRERRMGSNTLQKQLKETGGILCSGSRLSACIPGGGTDCIAGGRDCQVHHKGLLPESVWSERCSVTRSSIANWYLWRYSGVRCFWKAKPSCIAFISAWTIRLSSVQVWASVRDVQSADVFGAGGMCCLNERGV